MKLILIDDNQKYKHISEEFKLAAKNLAIDVIEIDANKTTPPLQKQETYLLYRLGNYTSNKAFNKEIDIYKKYNCISLYQDHPSTTENLSELFYKNDIKFPKINILDTNDTNILKLTKNIIKNYPIILYPDQQSYIDDTHILINSEKSLKYFINNLNKITYSDKLIAQENIAGKRLDIVYVLGKKILLTLSGNPNKLLHKNEYNEIEINTSSENIKKIAIKASQLLHREFICLYIITTPDSNYYIHKSHYPCNFIKHQSFSDIKFSDIILNHLISKAKQSSLKNSSHYLSKNSLPKLMILDNQKNHKQANLLKKEGNRYGIQCIAFNTKIKKGETVLFYRNHGEKLTEYSLYKNASIITINKPSILNKLTPEAKYSILNKHKIPSIERINFDTPYLEQVQKKIDSLKDFPYRIICQNSDKKHYLIANNKSNLINYYQYCRAIKHSMIITPYTEIYRCFYLLVINKSVISCLESISKDETQLSVNLQDSLVSGDCNNDIKKLAITATNSLGLNFSCVKIIQNKDGSLLIDDIYIENIKFLAFQRLTGINVAEHILLSLITKYDKYYDKKEGAYQIQNKQTQTTNANNPSSSM